MIKGLYVHIPFCHSICGYCDFAKTRYSQSMAESYLDHLEKEISEITVESFESIYIGGGTPTALSLSQLKRLFDILSRFKVEIEYTIEINPETFDLEKAKLLKEYGINRVSIGVQSFDEELLKHMGRTHKNEDVKNTLKYLELVEIKNRSIDLMYGFNVQTLSSLLQDLCFAVSLPITHISIYDLEVYPKTLFGVKNYQKIDDETNYYMYDAIIEFLNEHSFKQYEVSNFAFGKYRSHHNQLYWHYEDYLGVGLGACGKVKNLRYENTRSLLDYTNDKYRAEELKLSDSDVVFEAIMMGLRLLDGINISEFNRRFDVDLVEKYHSAINKNMINGLLEYNNGNLKVTSKGLFVLNDILVDFMED